MTKTSLEASKKITQTILETLQRNKKKFSHSAPIEFTYTQASKNTQILLTTLELLEERIEAAKSLPTLTPLEKPLLTLISQHINQAFTYLARIEQEENPASIDSDVVTLKTIFTSDYLDEAIHSAEDAAIDERPTSQHTGSFATFITIFGAILFLVATVFLAMGVSLAPAAGCMVLGALMTTLGISINKENNIDDKTLQLKSHVLLEKPYLIMVGQLSLLASSLATLRKYELTHPQ